MSISKRFEIDHSQSRITTGDCMQILCGLSACCLKTSPHTNRYSIHTLSPDTNLLVWTRLENHGYNDNSHIPNPSRRGELSSEMEASLHLKLCDTYFNYLFLKI